MAGLRFGKRNILRFDEEVQGGFLLETKRKVIPHRWAKDRKGMGTNSGKSGMRNLEAHLVKKME